MNFSEETKFLIELSTVAAKMITEAYHAQGCDFDSKSDKTLVTITDVEVNQMVIDRTQERYPDWGVLGEELSWNTEAETVLVVDPIDGTEPFIWETPVFGFMIALTKNKEVVAGLINNPIAQKTLVAEKDKGTYSLEHKMRVYVNKQDDLSETRININSKSKLVCNAFEQVGTGVLGIYSSCESAFLVATGAIAGALHGRSAYHDMVAPSIIIQEAGGKYTDAQGGAD